MFFATAMQALWGSEVGGVAIFFGLLPLIIQSFNNRYYLGHKLSEEILKYKIKIIPVITILFIINTIILILGELNINHSIVYILLGIAYIYLFYNIYIVLKILEDPQDIKQVIKKNEINYLNDLINQYHSGDKHQTLYLIKQQYFLYAQFCDDDFNDVKDIISFLASMYLDNKTKLENNTFMITGFIVALAKYHKFSNFDILALLCYVNYLINEQPDNQVIYNQLDTNATFNRISIPCRIFYNMIDEVNKDIIIPDEYIHLIVIILLSEYQLGGHELKTYKMMMEKINQSSRIKQALSGYHVFN